MKVKTIKYGMLRVTAQFENDRAEVEVSVEEGDSLGDVVREAKAICNAALGADRATVTRRATFDEVLEDARRREK